MVPGMATHCALHLDLHTAHTNYFVYELKRARSLFPAVAGYAEDDEKLRAALEAAMNSRLLAAEG
eukprot:11013696-Alexandrium_andersonii.AAC.1